MTGGGSGIGFEITRQLGKPTGSSDGKKLHPLFIRTYSIVVHSTRLLLPVFSSASALDLPATDVTPPWCLPLCRALSPLLMQSPNASQVCMALLWPSQAGASRCWTLLWRLCPPKALVQLASRCRAHSDCKYTALREHSISCMPQ